MEEIKGYPLKLPRELWAFLKKRSIDQDLTMNEIIVYCLQKHKKKCDKKLTEENINI